jgi:hypothetical protein
MEIGNINKMLLKQEEINKKFLNMPIERLDDVATLIIPPEDKLISQTRFFEDENGCVVIKRFIARKLYSLRFDNGLSIAKVNSWLEIEDGKFQRMAKLEVVNLHS